MRRGQSYVYFMRQVGGIGPIKIGCSTRPVHRMAELASWSPVDLELLLTVPGDFDLERSIHNCFADLYLHHEWFRAHHRLVSAINRVAAGEALAEVMDLTQRELTLSKKALHWARNPENRLRNSYSHRLNWAEKRTGGAVPEDVCGIMVRWRGYGHDYSAPVIQPTADEIARLDEVLAHPHTHLVFHEGLAA